MNHMSEARAKAAAVVGRNSGACGGRRIPRGLCAAVLLTAGLCLMGILPARAAGIGGLFGQLKSEVQQKAQEIKNAASKSGSAPANNAAAATQNGSDPDHPLQLSGQGHCQGRNSATCLDYMDVMSQCLAPLQGYRARMMAERIDWRLKQDPTLGADRRRNLQEDMAAFQDLAARKSNEEPTLGGTVHSQRYLSDVEDDDQIWVNAENARYQRQIQNKCEGADHMQTGHRTELIKDFGPTGDEAVAAYHKAHPATGPNAQAQAQARAAMETQATECSRMIGGLRYKIMADMMEKKMATLSLSAKERGEWQEDIAAVRQAAAAGGAVIPKVNDAANPYRPNTRLITQQEQMALQDETMKETKVATAECRQRAVG